MYRLLEQRLREIDTHRLHPYLRNARTGLEKESLRVNDSGRLSQRDHPTIFGSALTHPWITTDYAESLLELITPPQARAQRQRAGLYMVKRGCAAARPVTFSVASILNGLVCCPAESHHDHTPFR